MGCSRSTPGPGPLAYAALWLRLTPAKWSEGIEPTQSADLESAELAAAVRAALGELPADYEEILTAKYLDGDSVERIAGRERTTETAVRSKLTRARDAFRTAYARLTRTGHAEPEIARELP